MQRVMRRNRARSSNIKQCARNRLENAHGRTRSRLVKVKVAMYETSDTPVSLFAVDLDV